jgi:hypothetical protein
MSVLKGLDTTIELTRHAVVLKESNGFDFVLRYYSHRASKNLSLGEARALSDAQLQIGVVWETMGTQAAFFTYMQGLSDGSAAFQMAHSSIGQPFDSAIYFAVDYDATQADLDGPITDYFKGIRDAFVLASKRAACYPIGVYGSGLCCAYLLKRELATFSWLSQSTGFSGSADYKAKGLYNLVQKMPQSVVLDDGATIVFDPNESNSDRPTGLFVL